MSWLYSGRYCWLNSGSYSYSLRPVYFHCGYFVVVVVQVQLTVVIEGRYRVLVTIHSFVLFESRCAKCYVGSNTAPQRGLCCDGSNGESCPNSCDIMIAFRQNNAGSTNQFYSEGILGHDFKPNDVQWYNKTGETGFHRFAPVNPLQYGIETQVRRNNLQCQSSCNNMQTFTIIRLENNWLYQFMIEILVT